jgi:hypothetical protein
MPYIKKGRQKELLCEPQRANNDGDWNFLYTREYLKAFIAEPGYKTIALIRKASLTPSKLEGVKKVEDLLTVQGVNQLDRIVARDLAFAEFYRRVGAIYEEGAKNINGDLEAYEDALRACREKHMEFHTEKQ